jgi:hypothetical protein
MGRIKSALEIALERTSGIKGDKAGIEQFESKQKGKKLANDYLEDPQKSIADELKRCPRDCQESLKQGLFEALVSQISLPAVKEDTKRIETAARGLQAVISNSRYSVSLKQLGQILAQFLDETAQYAEAIKRQYAPKLRQKEEELSRRIGREVRIDPFQDPEFIAFYNQAMNALKENYQAAIDQFREETRRLFEESL